MVVTAESMAPPRSPAAASDPRPDAASTPAPRRGIVHHAALRVIALVALAFVLAFVLFASIAFGSKQIPLDVVRSALSDYDSTNPDHLIVHSLRVPRTIVGLLVGTALGLA